MMVAINEDIDEVRDNTMVLLKILALGSREIEWGKFRDAEEVFADLDKSDLNSSCR